MDHPARFICPISQDLMFQATRVNHLNFNYYFDKECIEMWKRTPGGDTNPLTGVAGFRETNMVDDLELQREISEYMRLNNIFLEREPLELYDVDDGEQIIEDFNIALEMNNQEGILNEIEPPPEAEPAGADEMIDNLINNQNIGNNEDIHRLRDEIINIIRGNVNMNEQINEINNYFNRLMNNNIINNVNNYNIVPFEQNLINNNINYFNINNEIIN